MLHKQKTTVFANSLDPDQTVSKADQNPLFDNWVVISETR